MPADVMRVTPQDFQRKFLESTKRFPCLVAGIGTGKTFFLLLKIWKYCMDYPGSLAIIVRREFTDLRDSTMKDFTRYFGVVADSNKEYKFSNGSTIMFRHGSEVAVLKNINAGIIGIEQGEEFEDAEVFTFLRDRLRGGIAPYRQLCVIANTNGDNWIKKLWKDKTLEESELVEATSFDNESNLPADFIRDLKRMEKEAPEHYRQYVMNDWNISGDQYILIKPQILDELKDIRIFHHTSRKIITCDPSQGGDECVIYMMDCTKIHDERILHVNDTMKIVGELMLLGSKYDISEFAVDTIGIGRGVGDRLSELGKKVHFINSSESATSDQFYNKRTEMWWYVSQRILHKDIEYPIDAELRRQLSSVRYKVINSNGKIQLEPKDITKKRLGRSPDRADAFVYGIWSLQDMIEENIYQPTIADFSNMQASESRGGW